jgi:periplasmic divalent cation tolerance protein
MQNADCGITRGKRSIVRESPIRNLHSEIRNAMKSARQFHVVLVTAPSLKVARQLARAALAARLIACANLLPKVESHYWWEGKIERGAEVLLVLKTTQVRLAKLEKLILAEHPYDTPEFLVLDLKSGSHRYLQWLAEGARG